MSSWRAQIKSRWVIVLYSAIVVAFIVFRTWHPRDSLLDLLPTSVVQWLIFATALIIGTTISAAIVLALATIRNLPWRLFFSELIAVPAYVVGFQFYICRGNWLCAALHGSDVWDSMLGRAIYPNFLVQDERHPVPYHLNPAPAWWHVIVLALAITLAVEFLNRRRKARMAR